MAESRVVILADDRDGSARDFASRHRDIGVRLATPVDLSSRGWSMRVGGARTAAAGGEILHEATIRGVLTRISSVDPAGLHHIALEDRDYVGAEMTAFLLAWLSGLRCPVINRPVAPFLSGPSWQWELWVRAARECGINIAHTRRKVSRNGNPVRWEFPQTDTVTVTIIGSKSIGAVDVDLMRKARALARAAGMDLLRVHFDGPQKEATLLGVDPWPALEDPEISAGILERLQ